MRRILVESARRKKQARRGGDWHRVPLEEDGILAGPPSDDLVALDGALASPEQHDAISAELVKLRYFVGFSMAEAAEARGISLRTAERNWTYARTWLHRAISHPDGEARD